MGSHLLKLVATPERHCVLQAIVISIGNKCDLREVKQVDFNLANKWAQKEKGWHTFGKTDNNCYCPSCQCC